MIAGVVSVPLLAFAATTPKGSIGIQLLEAPSNRRSDPRARIYIVDDLHPGDTIHRKIGVQNNTGAARTITLYAGAATIAGGAFIPSEGRGGNDVATWTTVSPSSLVVPNGKEGAAEVTIAVPKTASGGERYGVVWAELAGPGSVNRVGIRMYLSVSGGAEPRSDFVIDSLQAGRIEDGTPIVYARVRNTGGRAIDMSGTLQLSDGPGGASAGPFDARLGTTLGIRQSEPVTVPLRKDLPDGPWKAVITLRSGTIVRSAEATIELRSHPSAVARPVRARPLSTSRKVAATIAALVIAVCAGAALWFGFFRRRERT